MMKPIAGLTLVAAALLLTPAVAQAQFSYNPPGQLEAGTAGRVDYQVYVPGMRFPIENAPAYANSQVWGRGGSQGPGGGQCDAQNYAYPWSDTYCEPRTWDMPMCPSGTGHQGQDIRASTCENRVHPAVAAEDGTITSIGTYSVTLVTANGTRHRYLHMDPGTLLVTQGMTVTRGQRLGFVSNAFGGTPTTIHLHYDIQQNVSGLGNVYVPTYMSLVSSYEDLLGLEACDPLGAEGGIVDNRSRCFRLHGPPASWRYVEGQGHEDSLYWTYAWTSATPGNWAEWQLELQEAGRYEVAVSLLPEFSGSQQARWSVTHDGVTEELVVDQAGYDGWFVLGTFDFAAGASQGVAVYDNTGEALADQRRLMADAVRLTRIRPSEPEPGADNAPVDTSSGEDTQPATDTSSGEDTVVPGDDPSAPDASVSDATGGPDGAALDTTGGGDAGAADTHPTDDLAPLDDCACRGVRRSGAPGGAPGVGAVGALLLMLLGAVWARRRRSRRA